MNLYDLLLNVKAVSFDKLIPQTAIQTAEDKKRHLAAGYNIPLTEKELREMFEVDPSCVWYTPSISQSCIYFNKQSLAAAPFHMELFLYGRFLEKSSFYSVIQSTEEEAAQKKFVRSLLALPDAMKIEYFKLLVEKHGSDIPNLYDLFFSNYTAADYGFNHIDRQTLQAILSSKTAADYQKTAKELQKLPETFKIYRGGNSASTNYHQAYSWTLDINIANFFACRLGAGPGYIVEAEVQKKDVIEAFLSRSDEKEIIVDPKKVYVLSQIKIQGQDFLHSVLPSVIPTYQQYRDKIHNLAFTQASLEHGVEHEARVLLMSLTLAKCLNLPYRDQKVLAEASIYHDTKRTNDGVDFKHGKASREYYHHSAHSPDPLVEFLCEYHCLPDEDGFKEITNNPALKGDQKRVECLYKVFKDADALDRVRFGLKDLDINQLRLPVSKELSLIARMYYEQVKIPEKQTITKQSLSSRIKQAELKKQSATNTPPTREKRDPNRE